MVVFDALFKDLNNYFCVNLHDEIVDQYSLKFMCDDLFFFIAKY